MSYLLPSVDTLCPHNVNAFYGHHVSTQVKTGGPGKVFLGTYHALIHFGVFMLWNAIHIKMTKDDFAKNAVFFGLFLNTLR